MSAEHPAAKPPWDGYGDDREAKLVIHDGDCDDLTNPSVESRNPDGAGVSSGGGSETRPHPAAADSAAHVHDWIDTEGPNRICRCGHIEPIPAGDLALGRAARLNPKRQAVRDA